MLLDELNDFPSEVRENFKKITNQLLAVNYLSKDKPDNTKQYYFVVNYKKYFDELFSFMGYELLIDNTIGCVQLKNEYAATSLKLKKEESITILLLRTIYQEKVVTSILNNVVEITVDDIFNAFANLNIDKRLSKRETCKALRMFKKYNLVEILGDAEVMGTKLLIYPTITLAISVENIQNCYEYVKQLENESSKEGNE